MTCGLHSMSLPMCRELVRRRRGSILYPDRAHPITEYTGGIFRPSPPCPSIQLAAHMPPPARRSVPTKVSFYKAMALIMTCTLLKPRVMFTDLPIQRSRIHRMIDILQGGYGVPVQKNHPEDPLYAWFDRIYAVMQSGNRYHRRAATNALRNTYQKMERRSITPRVSLDSSSFHDVN